MSVNLLLVTAAVTFQVTRRRSVALGAAHPGSLVAGRHLVITPFVSVRPNSTLPGTAQLQQLVGGLMTWVLLACVCAVLAGAAAWGFGSRSGHFAAAQQGRAMVLGGAVGALVTGAAVALINYAFGVGGTVH